MRKRFDSVSSVAAYIDKVQYYNCAMLQLRRTFKAYQHSKQFWVLHVQYRSSLLVLAVLINRTLHNHLKIIVTLLLSQPPPSYTQHIIIATATLNGIGKHFGVLYRWPVSVLAPVWTLQGVRELELVVKPGS